MIRTVAAVLTDRVAMFELGVAVEVFGIDRTRDGVPPFELRVCSLRPGVPTPATQGVCQVIAPYGLDGVEGADLVIVPAGVGPDDGPRPHLIQALQRAYDAGAIVLSVCSGAFLLADAGLLDGRRCATHWRYADELQRTHPAITVDRDVLFVDEGRIITSAGTAAGIDACLHLVRRELGSEVATRIARRMVVAPQREGGQRQFVETPIPASTADSLAPLLAWMSEHLEQDQPVAGLAARAAMSPRTFARRFVAETGTTPHRWLVAQRVLAARTLLESTDRSVEQVAAACGFGDAALLRHHFRCAVGVSPQRYRSTFSGDRRPASGTPMSATL